MKKYNFDEIIDRKNTDCLKHDGMPTVDGGNDYTAMWVADMDFKVADEILAAIKNRTDHAVFGYGIRSKSYFQAAIDFYVRRHNLKMEMESMLIVPGVVAGIHWTICALTNQGDGITIMTPVYGPFKNAVEKTKRTLHQSELINDNGKYKIDFADFEEKLKLSKMFILCSPHNPAGRVWEKEELEKIAQLCLKHNVLVIADEIHCDLIMPSHKHIPFVNISNEIAQKTITLVSPSKTFNLAGLLLANIYIADKEMFDKVDAYTHEIACYLSNVLSVVAAEAAYQHGDEWLDQLANYINGNYQYMKDRFEKEMPKSRVVNLEGTYLMWLDCREITTDGSVLKEIFENKGRVIGQDGSQFGDAGAGYYRMNLACPRSVCKIAADKMIAAYNKYAKEK